MDAEIDLRAQTTTLLQASGSPPLRGDPRFDRILREYDLAWGLEPGGNLESEIP